MNKKEQSSLTREKKQLRGLLKERRASISAEDRKKKTFSINQSLIKLIDTQIAKNHFQTLHIGAFYPLQNEVDLSAFFEHVYQCPSCVLAFPVLINMHETNPGKISSSYMNMRVVDYQSWKDASAAFFKNPIKVFSKNDVLLNAYPALPAEQIDILICPLLGFDSNNNRIGYGGGFYDRYLSQLNELAQTIGVAFEEQRCACIPYEDHDARLDAVIFA